MLACAATPSVPPRAGGAANPYVSIEVGDERRRTAVETNTVNPVWDEEIMVFSETSLRNVRTPLSLLLAAPARLKVEVNPRVYGFLSPASHLTRRAPAIKDAPDVGKYLKGFLPGACQKRCARRREVFEGFPSEDPGFPHPPFC